MKINERVPILLSKNAIALIQIFTKFDNLEDSWIIDISNYYENNKNIYKKAAKQFVSQLEGQWCIEFMEELQKEINICLEKIGN